MKDKIDEITYNLELGCINWQEASKQLFALCELHIIVVKIRHKKNVDSGSTFKTFVNSLPKVKNNANVQNVFKYEYFSTI